MSTDSSAGAEVEVRLYRDGTGYVLPRGFNVEPFEISEASLDAAADRAMRFVVEQIARPRGLVVHVYGTTPDSTVQLVVGPTGTITKAPPSTEDSTASVLPGTEAWWRAPDDPSDVPGSSDTSIEPTSTTTSAIPEPTAVEAPESNGRGRTLATAVVVVLVLAVAVSLTMVLSPDSDDRSDVNTDTAEDAPTPSVQGDPTTPPPLERSTAPGPPEKTSKPDETRSSRTCTTIETKQNVPPSRMPRVPPGAFSKRVQAHAAAVKIGRLSPAYVQRVPVRKRLIKTGPNIRALSVLDPAPPATSCTGVTVVVGHARTSSGQPGALPGLSKVQRGASVTWKTQSQKVRFTVSRRLSVTGRRIPSRFLTAKGPHRLLVLVSNEPRNRPSHLTGFVADATEQDEKGTKPKSKKGTKPKSKKGTKPKSKKGTKPKSKKNKRG